MYVMLFIYSRELLAFVTSVITSVDHNNLYLTKVSMK
jgi:hypothetical protein